GRSAVCGGELVAQAGPRSRGSAPAGHPALPDALRVDRGSPGGNWAAPRRPVARGAGRAVGGGEESAFLDRRAAARERWHRSQDRARARCSTLAAMRALAALPLPVFLLAACATSATPPPARPALPETFDVAAIDAYVGGHYVEKGFVGLSVAVVRD